MNRKLHNILLALSISGLILVSGLMATTPIAPLTPAPAASAALAGVVTVAPPDNAIKARAELRAAALQARTRRFEVEMRQVNGFGDGLARTASFAAEVAAEAALAAALTGIESAAAETGSAALPERKPQRKRPTARSAFATPYFSFARSLRQGNGA